MPSTFVAGLFVAGHTEHPWVMGKLSSGKSAPVPVINWIEEDARLLTYTPSSTQTSSDTVLVLDKTTDLRVGDILLNEAADGDAPAVYELIRISAIGSSPAQITVTRGFSGTVQGAVAAARPLKLVGSAAIEGAAHSDTYTKADVHRKNYAQIFTEEFSMSRTELASKYVGGENPLVARTRSNYVRLIEKLSRSFIQGGANGSSPAGDGSTVGMYMDGLIEMMRTGQAASDGGLHIDGTAASFATASTAWDNFNDYLRQIADNGGRPTAVLASGRVAQQLSRDGANTANQARDGVATRNIAFIDSVFGQMPIHYESTAVSDSTCVFIKDEMVDWHWLGEGADQLSIKLNESGPDGQARKFELTCQGCPSAVGAYSGVGFGTVFGLGA